MELLHVAIATWSYVAVFSGAPFLSLSPLLTFLFFSAPSPCCRYQEGSGEPPVTGKKILAHYTGRLLDGTVFDSSVKRGKPFEFNVGTGNVIKGWDRGFATMKPGEKAFLTCGPSYAYGASGSPPLIPANATLRFEVEYIGPAPKADWELTEEEKVAAGEAAKGEGNAAFTQGDLLGASEAYARAWAKLSSLHSEDTKALRLAVKSNSAAVALKQGDYAKAAKEADTAVLIDPSNAKAQFRLGSALAGLARFAEAKKALVAAAKLAPADAAIRAEYQRVAEAQAKAKAVSAGAWKGMFKKGTLGIGSGEEEGGAGSKAGGCAALAEEDTDEEEEEGGEGEGAKAPEAEAEGAGEKLDEE